MPLHIQTARISYGGEHRYDITRKSGGRDGQVFAPSWALLNHVKEAFAKATSLRSDGESGAADALETSAWEEYKPRYIDEMRQSYRTHRVTWDALLALPHVVLVCYCVLPPTGPRAERCHRRLLAGPDILSGKKIGAIDDGEIPSR